MLIIWSITWLCGDFFLIDQCAWLSWLLSVFGAGHWRRCSTDPSRFTLRRRRICVQWKLTSMHHRWVIFFFFTWRILDAIFHAWYLHDAYMYTSSTPVFLLFGVMHSPRLPTFMLNLQGSCVCLCVCLLGPVLLIFLFLMWRLSVLSFVMTYILADIVRVIGTWDMIFREVDGKQITVGR